MTDKSKSGWNNPWENYTAPQLGQPSEDLKLGAKSIAEACKLTTNFYGTEICETPTGSQPDLPSKKETFNGQGR
jgi:hypothetical protein